MGNKIVGVIVVILGAIGIYKLATGAKAVARQVLAGGEIISRWIAGVTPVPLTAGSINNKAVVAVQNTSVYQDTSSPAPYTFKVEFALNTATGILAYEVKTLSLGASASDTLEFIFSLPAGGGASATARASLMTTDGVTMLRQIFLPVTINAGGTVTPGGTIAF